MPRSERAAYRAHRQKIGCRVLCRILGLDIRTEGNPPSEHGVLVVCNHFGVLDPLVLATALPVAFVGKAEIKKWPFLGWVAATHGLIFVERERPTKVSSFTQRLHRRFRSGVDVLVFPEGTTSPDEKVLPFKTGAFAAVAENPDQCILPVYLRVDSVEGEPAVGDVRHRVVWSDPDLPFLRHVWLLLGLRRVEMTVLIGHVLTVGERNRKELAQVAREAVEALRDGRNLPEIAF